MRTLKIENVEKVRTDTYKVTVRLQRQQLRIVVYPAPLAWLVCADDNVQWLQSDLSDKQQAAIRRAVRLPPI